MQNRSNLDFYNHIVLVHFLSPTPLPFIFFGDTIEERELFMQSNMLIEPRNVPTACLLELVSIFRGY